MLPKTIETFLSLWKFDCKGKVSRNITDFLQVLILRYESYSVILVVAHLQAKVFFLFFTAFHRINLLTF